ncbi:hypothetical protein ACUN22_37740 [Streptomyces anulatus]
MGRLQTLATVAGKVFKREDVSYLGAIPGPLAPWSAARDIPAPPTETFREWFARTDGGRLDESGQAAAGSRPNRAGVDVEGHYGTSARDAGLPHPTSDSEDEA